MKLITMASAFLLAVTLMISACAVSQQSSSSGERESSERGGRLKTFGKAPGSGSRLIFGRVRPAAPVRQDDCWRADAGWQNQAKGLLCCQSANHPPISGPVPGTCRHSA